MEDELKRETTESRDEKVTFRIEHPKPTVEDKIYLKGLTDGRALAARDFSLVLSGMMLMLVMLVLAARYNID